MCRRCLTTIVSGRYTLQLWVRGWGDVFWHYTERQRAAAAAQILLKEKRGGKKKTPSRTCFWCWPAYMTRVRGGGWVESSVALAKQSLTWQMVLGLCFCVPPSLSWLINGVHYIRPSPWPSCDSIFWFDSDYPFREMVPHFGHRLPNYIDTSCHLSLHSHTEAMLESPFNLHVFAWWQKAGAPREKPT